LAEVKWIKITTTMFDDEKIRVIEGMPEADAILVIWIKLLTLAGKNNSNGFIFLAENIPYADETLSTIFNRPLNTVRLALQVFKQFKMIEFDENGYLQLTNWGKHQNLEGLDKIREQTRMRVAKHREIKKLLPPAKDNATVTLRNAIELDKNKKEIKNKNKDIKTLSSKVFADDSLEAILAIQLKYAILKNNPNAKTPDNIDKWAAEIDKMLRLDKREFQDIQKVIEFCQSDTFWMANVLSTKTLRAKFDTLFLQSKNGRSGKPKIPRGFQSIMDYVGSDKTD
jgi:predicted phage replisome organizer